MKLTNTFFRVLKSAIFLIALFLFAVPKSAFAADINWNWGNHAKVEWDKGKGAIKFSFICYTEAGDDDHTDYLNLYIDGSKYLDAYNNHQADMKSHWVNIESWSSGTVYADSKDGWNEITTSTSGENVWFNGATPCWAVIYIYPKSEHMNKTVSINLEGRVRDSDNDTWSYNTTTKLTTSPYSYQGKLASEGWDLNTGAFKVKLTELTNGDVYKETKSTISLRTKTYDGSWTPRNVSYTTSKGQKSINYTWSRTDYIKYSNYNNSTILTARQFANGISFDTEAKTDPDAGSGNYVKTEVWSGSIHTGRTAVFENRNLTITQNNRDINLSWQVYNPSSSSNLNTADFAVEKWNGSEWVEIETIDYNYSKSSYSYTYTLSDAECNKGSQTYKFRVWKKMFAKQEWWHEYMSTNETSATIYTDYKKVEITSISPVEGKTEAIVKWAFTSSNGIWDDKGAYSLSINGGGNSRSFTPAYNETQYKISSLQGCVRYEVSLSQTALSKSHHTSATKSFLMPNLNRREIENFEVSKGYYSDNVMLSWNVPSDASDFK